MGVVWMGVDGWGGVGRFRLMLLLLLLLLLRAHLRPTDRKYRKTRRTSPGRRYPSVGHMAVFFPS